MRIALVCSPTSWYLHDLRRAAGDRHEIVPLPFRDLQSHVGSAGLTVTAGGFDLSRADAVLVRTMPPGSLEQVVLRMDLLARLEAAGTPVINPPRAIEAAVDKYLTTAKLAAAGLPVPRTSVCQTVESGLEAFDALGGDVVVKPLFGGEGRGIARLTDRALAERTFSLLVGLGAVLYLQAFVCHPGYDVRVLLVGKQAFGMRRRQRVGLADQHQPGCHGRAAGVDRRAGRAGSSCGRSRRRARGRSRLASRSGWPLARD